MVDGRKFHVSPKTGNPNICRAASGNCPFGDEAKHYPNREAAASAFEASQESVPGGQKRLPLAPPGALNPLLKEAKLEFMQRFGEPFKARDGGRYLFLTVRGVNVSAVKIYDEYYGEKIPPELCDVETRPEYRHQGYASKILQEVATHYGVEKLVHGGGYTQNGFDYVSKKLHRSEGRPPAAVEFPEYTDDNPFIVIEDWDNQITRWDG